MSMGRVVFAKGKQGEFIKKILRVSKVNVGDLAMVANVSSRTIRDWRREKFTLSDEALKLWSKRFVIQVPTTTKTVPDYWYTAKGARKGALRRMELHGPLGTSEGRSKGGKMSQLVRKLHPEKYANCILRKEFVIPKLSKDLAEAVGIILGDGGISNYQVKVTLNSDLEGDYAEYVSGLFNRVFGETPRKHQGHTNKKDVNICVSGANFVKLLESIGLRRGNKVKHQVRVPGWIVDDQRLSVACLRGLMDTDGCVFLHNHVTHGVRCLNMGMCFSSHSEPLLEFVHSTLARCQYTPKFNRTNVYLYRGGEVNSYFSKIGSHNSHHLARWREYCKKKSF